MKRKTPLELVTRLLASFLYSAAFILLVGDTIYLMVMNWRAIAIMVITCICMRISIGSLDK